MEKEQLLETGRQITGQIYEKMGIIEQCDSIIGAVSGLPVCFLDNGNVIGLEKVLTDEQMGKIRDMAINTILENSREAEEWLERLNIATMQTKEEHESSDPVIVTEEEDTEKTEKEEQKVEPEEKTAAKKTTKKRAKQKKEEQKVESISEIQAKADEAGLTYGQYMAQQSKDEVTVKKRGRKPNIVITEKELAELYVKKHMTVQEIADATETDKKSVFAKLEEYGLKEPSGMSESERDSWAKKVMDRY